MIPRRVAVFLVLVLVASSSVLAPVQGQRVLTLEDTVTVQAAAVVRTSDGTFEGSTARMEVSVARNGSGHVFMDTVPLTQVDMQGSARLAVRVAATLAGIPREEFDYFFVVRSNSPIIGGPSAGAILTAATVAAIKGWDVDPRVMMTGTVNPDGTVGPVGGIPEKAEASWRSGARLFLYPEGQSNASRHDGTVVHMPTFCSQELGITCRPVTDVRSAVRSLTGYAFQQPSAPGNVTTEGYRAVMRPLAQELLVEANASLGNATTATSGAELPAEVREDVDARLTAAERAVEEGVEAWERGNFYTTASRSFQATVQARTVVEVVRTFEARDRDAHVSSRFSAVRDQVTGALEAAGAAEPRGLSELQAVGAAQSRALEARSSLESARGRYVDAQEPMDIVASMADVAYARARVDTVHWWLDIGTTFAGGPTIASSDLQESQRDVRSTSRESLSYARLLLEEMDAAEGHPALSRAEDLLSQSDAAKDQGFTAAAIFDALQAETWASVALETMGLRSERVDDRVNRSRDRAAVGIAESRELGVEPILAVAYFEFAGELPNPVDKLAFYGFAKTIARSSGFLLDADGSPNPSRFVGADPAVTGPVVRVEDVVALFALSLTLGVGLAVAATSGVLTPRDGSTGRRRDDGP